jgi:hypothetical protein
MPRYQFAPRSVHTADFTGDGRPDIVMRHQVQVLFLLVAQPDGSVPSATSFYTGDYIADSMAAEATGDAHTDMIVADTATNTIRVLPANGDGTFRTPVVTALPFAPSQIAKGDFNRDHKLDLAVRSYSASLLVVLTGDGAARFRPRIDW